MFDKVLDLSQNFMSNLSNFVNTIIDFMSREYTIGDTSYSLFTLMFTSAIIIIIGWGIVKFITDIVL